MEFDYKCSKIIFTLEKENLRFNQIKNLTKYSSSVISKRIKYLIQKEFIKKLEIEEIALKPYNLYALTDKTYKMIDIIKQIYEENEIESTKDKSE